jgi:hypothetical protein
MVATEHVVLRHVYHSACWCGHAASMRASVARPPNAPFQPIAAREIVRILTAKSIECCSDLWGGAAEWQSVGR